MLSGIGDPGQLQAHGVTVRAALPGVGAHLCDHPVSNLVLALREAERALPTSNLVESGLFMKSAALNDGFAADLQLFAIPFAPMQVGA
jgi:choline dehydrogenase